MKPNYKLRLARAIWLLFFETVFGIAWTFLGTVILLALFGVIDLTIGEFIKFFVSFLVCYLWERDAENKRISMGKS
jgi:hypothetical protein